MNTKERASIIKLHDKIDCVDGKLEKFLQNDWVHMVRKVVRLRTDVSWVKKITWLILAGIIGLVLKAFIL